MVGPVRGRVEIDHSKCLKCYKCVELCPCNALSVKNGLVKQVGFCMACYGCTVICPSKAISIDIESDSFRVVEIVRGPKGLEKFFRSASPHH